MSSDPSPLPAQRTQQILEELRQQGRVVAADLARRYAVSEDSIRRDLRELAAQGLCQRVYGGAVLPPPKERPLRERLTRDRGDKAELASRVCALLQPGQVVLLDAGSTNLAIAQQLPAALGLTLITNAPQIATAASVHEGTSPPPVSGSPPPVQRTPMKIPFAAVLALALVVPSAAFAKSTDRNEDMHIDSGAQSGMLTGDGKTVLSQGVIITQGTLDLRSSEAEIYLKDGEPVRAVFTGKQATMKQQLDDGTWMDAVADRIDYDIKTEIITLTGNYKVTSARGTNAGQRMVYNTRSGEMNSGGDGSRVRTVIPPKNKNPAAQPAKPAGSKK